MKSIIDLFIMICGVIWVGFATVFIWLIKADFEFAESWPTAFGIWAFIGLLWLVLWFIKIKQQN